MSDPDQLCPRYQAVRACTERLCAPLEIEDHVVQTMADVSPPKWHLAHSTWFFEAMVLERFVPDYRVVDPAYGLLFNSYYESVGPRWSRPQRGTLARPTVAEVRDYRRAVDERMRAFLKAGDPELVAAAAAIVEIGLHHEQQHQELLLTDILHIFASNPLRPRYHEPPPAGVDRPCALSWRAFPGGRHDVGWDRPGFCFDNERPRHGVWLEPFELASRCVSNGEYLEFMAAGGYADAGLWLSDGCEVLRTQGWQAPLYWERRDEQWWQMTLHGMQPVDPDEPVCHLSFYEADAYARWAGARLPSEEEWELAASSLGVSTPRNTLDSGRLHPAVESEPFALLGNLWEWSASPYRPYPGFRPFDGSLAEYNGKFMMNQMVLRGGSCASPGDHLRLSYRNFFQPDKRWQFTGLRLAR